MNIKYAAVPIILSLLTACQPIENLAKKEGEKGAFQIETERRAALTMPAPENLEVGTPPAPVALIAVTEPPKPPCAPVFRVVTCLEDGTETTFVMPGANP